MTNDKQRERLVELLKQADQKVQEYILENDHMDWIPKANELAEVRADYLLENGVIVPPCKVGDKLYIVAEVSGKIIECTVIGAWICEGNCNVITDCGTIYNLSYGETVFLSRKEAKEALGGVQ